MWIRSQDKKTLVKVDKLIIGYDKDEKVYEIHNVYDSLGIYKSKERAIEVLDEIQNKIVAFELGKANCILSLDEIVYQIPNK